MSSHLSNAANAALGTDQKGVQNKDREAYMLLNLTESESDQDILPDLNLIAPAPVNNGAAHRIKKKIRLKRRQRDSIRHSMGSDGSGHLSDPDSDWYLTVPSCSAKTICLWSCVLSVLGTIFTLAYLAAQLHIRVSSLELTLENALLLIRHECMGPRDLVEGPDLIRTRQILNLLEDFCPDVDVAPVAEIFSFAS